MVVKKAASAAKTDAPPRKPAPTRAVTRKSTTKASATETMATNAPKKTATKASATKMATKVSATMRTTKAAAKTATKTPTKASAANATSGPRGRRAGASTSSSDQPQRLRVRENEKPWTTKELATVHAELEADIARLQREISVAEVDLAGLMRDVGEGAGDDPADAGTATFEREQEISLANNAREVFEQSARALARLVDGSYGICESCGSPIGKNRLLAFPRATLCMTCKSKQERR